MSYLGIIDLSKVFVNEYLVDSAIVGGIIMGGGFVMGGFCPGTGISAASIGKINAIVFLAGGMIGAFIFQRPGLLYF